MPHERCESSNLIYQCKSDRSPSLIRTPRGQALVQSYARSMGQMSPVTTQMSPEWYMSRTTYTEPGRGHGINSRWSPQKNVCTETTQNTIVHRQVVSISQSMTSNMESSTNTATEIDPILFQGPGTQVMMGQVTPRVQVTQTLLLLYSGQIDW